MKLAGILDGHARVASNVTVTNSTLTNITGLNFSIGAKEVWTFEAYLKVSSSSTLGIAVGLTVPASAVIQVNVFGNVATVSAFTTGFITATATPLTGFLTTAITGIIVVRGTIVNSTTSGTVQLQFANSAAGTQTGTIFANSYLIGRRAA